MSLCQAGFLPSQAKTINESLQVEHELERITEKIELILQAIDRAGYQAGRDVSIALDPAWIEATRRGLPELPLARYERLVAECGLSEGQAESLCRDPDLARLFDETLAEFPEPRDVANWLGNAVREELNARGVGLSTQRSAPARA